MIPKTSTSRYSLHQLFVQLVCLCTHIPGQGVLYHKAGDQQVVHVDAALSHLCDDLGWLWLVRGARNIGFHAEGSNGFEELRLLF